jgi:hypothetical protein
VVAVVQYGYVHEARREFLSHFQPRSQRRLRFFALDAETGAGISQRDADSRPDPRDDPGR